MVQDTNKIEVLLKNINPTLEWTRKGAWQTFNSNSLDGFSQAMGSMREVFTQLLHELAPDEVVLKAPWYKEPPKGDTKITRYMRIRFALAGNLDISEISKKDVDLIESLAKVINILYDKLSALVHKRGIGIELQVDGYLKLCEIAIINLLVNRKVINGSSIELRCDLLPFRDIRVRKALQMAIDRKKMAEVLDNGWAVGKPAGLISPKYIGFYKSYDQWPKDLRDEYTYNPAEARRLLTEAGYPNGFRTNIMLAIDSSIETVQEIKRFLTEIGVEMEIRVCEKAFWVMLAQNDKVDQMIGLTLATAIDKDPYDALSRRSSKDKQNYTNNTDEKYEELMNQIKDATTSDELKKLCIEADLHALRQHWAIQLYI
jgi:ABC-type transport system substrate-binding protein